jgi:anionic cell wall polymer biosynthesis LytR-Cps2A-Psr (LCP) family protein
MLDRRNRREQRSIILLALILVVVAAAAVYAFLQIRVDEISDSLKKKIPVNALFVVSDGEKPLFFEVFLYNPATRKGALFHVPTNLGGVIESLKRVDGLDALYRRIDPEPLKKKMEQLLGVTIQCVIDVSLDDVMRVVDLVGGLDIFIPNPVDMVWKAKRILLPSGSVTLDGDKTRDFLTYEDPLESDADKVGRKQKFLQALLKGLGEKEAFLLQRSSSRMLRSLIRTTLSPRALDSFLVEMGKFDAERMVLQRVLGNNRSVDGRELLFPHQDGDLLRAAVKQTLEANASNELTPAEDLTVTVEVLNGTKTSGLASRARDLFQSYGLEVFSPGNADNDGYDVTVVLDRKGKLENAKKVADIINCTRIYSRPDTEMDQAVDVTVILGKDFDGRTCKQ